MSALGWLGNYISKKRNFLKVSVFAMGCPTAAIGAWALRSFGPIVPLMAVAVAFIGSYFWGLIMWSLVFKDIYARRQAMTTSTPFSAPTDSDKS